MNLSDSLMMYRINISSKTLAQLQQVPEAFSYVLQGLYRKLSSPEQRLTRGYNDEFLFKNSQGTEVYSMRTNKVHRIIYTMSSSDDGLRSIDIQQYLLNHKYDSVRRKPNVVTSPLRFQLAHDVEQQCYVLTSEDAEQPTDIRVRDGSAPRLTLRQQEVVDSKANIIIGSAGTGKTSVSFRRAIQKAESWDDNGETRLIVYYAPNKLLADQFLDDWQRWFADDYPGIAIETRIAPTLSANSFNTFKTWHKKNLKKIDDVLKNYSPAALYGELWITAVYLDNHTQYMTLNNSETTLPINVRGAMLKLADLYHSHCKTHPDVIFPLWIEPTGQKPALIIYDEAHLFPLRFLAQMRIIYPDNNLYCFDAMQAIMPHQRQLSHVLYAVGSDYNSVEVLTQSHRVSPHIASMLNDITAVKQRLNAGKFLPERFPEHIIPVSNVGYRPLVTLDTNAVKQDLPSYRIAVSTVVIFDERHRKEAAKVLGVAHDRILHIREVPGLEFVSLIIYRPFSVGPLATRTIIDRLATTNPDDLQLATKSASGKVKDSSAVHAISQLTAIELALGRLKATPNAQGYIVTGHNIHSVPKVLNELINKHCQMEQQELTEDEQQAVLVEGYIDHVKNVLQRIFLASANDDTNTTLLLQIISELESNNISLEDQVLPALTSSEYKLYCERFLKTQPEQEEKVTISPAQSKNPSAVLGTPSVIISKINQKNPQRRPTIARTPIAKNILNPERAEEAVINGISKLCEFLDFSETEVSNIRKFIIDSGSDTSKDIVVHLLGNKEFNVILETKFKQQNRDKKVMSSCQKIFVAIIIIGLTSFINSHFRSEDENQYRRNNHHNGISPISLLLSASCMFGTVFYNSYKKYKSQILKFKEVLTPIAYAFIITEIMNAFKQRKKTKLTVDEYELIINHIYLFTSSDSVGTTFNDRRIAVATHILKFDMEKLRKEASIIAVFYPEQKIDVYSELLAGITDLVNFKFNPESSKPPQKKKKTSKRKPR